MDVWTFVVIIVSIVVAGDVLRKALQGLQFRKANKVLKQEIEDLKRRVDELEHQAGKKEIEKRLQAIEKIVVDGEYDLNMRIKKALEDKSNE